GAFEVQSGAATRLTVSAPARATAGTPFDVTVTALEADGHPATGYTGTVTFRATDTAPAVVLPADYTFTAADNGTHTFTVTLTTAGTQAITARDAAAGILGTTRGITVTPAAASAFVVAGFPSAVAAGLAGTFTVTAVDPYGNVATDYSGTVHFPSSDPRAVLPAAAAPTNSTRPVTATLGPPGHHT